MRTVHVQPDEAYLSRLLDDVAAGEEIVLSKAGKPVAKLVPMSAEERPKRKLGALQGKYVIPENFDDPLWEDTPREKRKLGGLRGKFELPPNFDDPLPEEFLKFFEGGE